MSRLRVLVVVTIVTIDVKCLTRRKLANDAVGSLEEEQCARLILVIGSKKMPMMMRLSVFLDGGAGKNVRF